MTVIFTEEEKEWIIIEKFNWHIADNCPEDMKKVISEKLRKLNGEKHGSRV